MHSGSLTVLLQCRLWFSGSQWAGECAFLVDSQVMWMLLAQGWQLEGQRVRTFEVRLEFESSTDTKLLCIWGWGLKCDLLIYKMGDNHSHLPGWLWGSKQCSVRVSSRGNPGKKTLIQENAWHSHRITKKWDGWRRERDREGHRR